MANPLIRQFPNIITVLRLLLVAPICFLIVNRQFDQVLWLSLIAGLSDGVDGWIARTFNAQTRFGSIVDPVSDKALLVGSYCSFAVVHLIPWWFAALIVARDIIIVSGAVAYHKFVGRFRMQPSFWGKLSTLFQIAFALALIAQQVWPLLPDKVFDLGIAAVVALALISCGHYAFLWGRKGRKAMQQRKT